jgi:hypothetical protein
VRGGGVGGGRRREHMYHKEGGSVGGDAGSGRYE